MNLITNRCLKNIFFILGTYKLGFDWKGGNWYLIWAVMTFRILVM